MPYQVNYDSESWVSSFFSLRSGLFWSFILSVQTWLFFVWFFIWYILCRINAYCVETPPGTTEISFFFWIFLSMWTGYVFSRFFSAFQDVSVALGRISDMQSQVTWIPPADAHDILRWALSFLIVAFLEASNFPEGKIEFSILRERRLLADAEVASLERAQAVRTSVSTVPISWIFQRLSALGRSSTITGNELGMFMDQARELRRAGANIAVYGMSQIPWPLHQMANAFSVGYILLLGISYSGRNLGFFSFILQLFAINMTRIFVGRLGHPFRLNVGWRRLRAAPTANYHAFPLLFGKVRAVATWLDFAAGDIYLSTTFKPYKCSTAPSSAIAFNAPHRVAELNAALLRHNTICLRPLGNSYVVDWCHCTSESIKVHVRSPWNCFARTKAFIVSRAKNLRASIRDNRKGRLPAPPPRPPFPPPTAGEPPSQAIKQDKPASTSEPNDASAGDSGDAADEKAPDAPRSYDSLNQPFVSYASMFPSQASMFPTIIPPPPSIAPPLPQLPPIPPMFLQLAPAPLTLPPPPLPPLAYLPNAQSPRAITGRSTLPLVYPTTAHETLLMGLPHDSGCRTRSFAAAHNYGSRGLPGQFLSPQCSYSPWQAAHYGTTSGNSSGLIGSSGQGNSSGGKVEGAADDNDEKEKLEKYRPYHDTCCGARPLTDFSQQASGWVHTGPWGMTIVPGPVGSYGFGLDQATIIGDATSYQAGDLIRSSAPSRTANRRTSASKKGSGNGQQSPPLRPSGKKPSESSVYRVEDTTQDPPVEFSGQSASTNFAVGMAATGGPSGG